jgi:hypothetical protein
MSAPFIPANEEEQLSCHLPSPAAPSLRFRPSIRREQCSIARVDIYDGETMPSIG